MHLFKGLGRKDEQRHRPCSHFSCSYLRSAATLEIGITSASSAKVLKSGDISPREVIRSLQDSLNWGFPDPASTRFTGRKFLPSGAAAPRCAPRHGYDGQGCELFKVTVDRHPCSDLSK